MRLFIIILLLVAIGNLALAGDSITPDGLVNSEGVPLRLRAGPGLNYPVLDLLTDGTPLLITGRTPNDRWLEVGTLGDYRRLGWVYAEYVSISIPLASLPDHTGPLRFRNLVFGITDQTRSIYQRGQQLGNRPGVFAKVGDSITVSHHMLHPIGEGLYNLDAFDYLQPVIDHFLTADVRDGNAFTNVSVAAGVGWNAAAVLLPKFTDPNQCEPGEMPLLCEYRTLRPAFALIMFGTNDVSYVPTSTYRHNLERIVETSIDMGIVPVISTIPSRADYEQEVVAYNRIIHEVTQRYEIPLWDYGYAMAVHESTSFSMDGVHPSLPPLGHHDVANFKPGNLYYGYVLRNLSALHVLDALWREIVLPTE